MTNVEKIKEGLKCCSHPKEENCNRCPYKYPLYPSGDRDAWLASCQEMFEDALELIEKQENEIEYLKTLLLGHEAGARVANEKI